MLTLGINHIQSSNHLSRTGWQIINTVHDKTSVGKTALVNIMKPFAHEHDVEDILEELKNKGLITISHDNNISLPGKGHELHARCLEKQQAFRKTAMNGISDEDYSTTVSTLQKIVGNINRLNE